LVPAGADRDAIVTTSVRVKPGTSAVPLSMERGPKGRVVMPIPITKTLERWRDAVRRLNEARLGSPEWLRASEDAVLAKADYLRATKSVGDEMTEKEAAARERT
jgi:hypothetical protein